MSRASMAGWLALSFGPALVIATGCRSLDSGAAVASKTANASLAATTAAATNLASGTTARVAGATDGATPAPAIPLPKPGSHVGPFTQLTEQQALSQVLPELQALALSDPTTHNAVLEQMARSEPSLWPLAIERAKSTAALRQKLAGAQAPPNAVATQATAPTGQASTEQRAPLVTTTSPESPVARVASLRAEQPSNVAKPTWPAPPPTNVAPASATQPVAPPAPPSTPPAATPQRIENHHYFGDASPKSGAEPEPGPDGSTIRLVSATSDTPNGASSASRATAERRPAGTWRESVESAIATLESSLAGATGDRTSEHARLRLLRLVADQEGPAVAAIPGLPAAEQGYWSEQLYALATMLDTARRPERPMRVAAAALHQQVAAERLGELGDLAVRNAAFCENVYGFGAYEPISRPRFRAGEQATLYAEVDRYRSESTERGYHTSLATHYRVLNAAGKVVDEGDFPVVEDHCLSVRRDFHIQYGVAFPESLAPGAYRIELVINDQLGKKSGTDAVAFEVVAP